MDTQNRFPTAPFRAVNRHLAIKATGTEQGRVEDIGTVGCGQNHNGLVWFEAIHLDKQLLQCMFSFIVAGNGTRASPATARASKVLPVPGGPTSSTPLGICAPILRKRWGSRKKSITSRNSILASSTPATSAKVVVGRSSL